LSLNTYGRRCRPGRAGQEAERQKRDDDLRLIELGNSGFHGSATPSLLPCGMMEIPEASISCYASSLRCEANFPGAGSTLQTVRLDRQSGRESGLNSDIAQCRFLPLLLQKSF
jgi:hypothetical protein